MTTGTTTPQGDPGAGHSTTKSDVGEVVLVLIEPGIRRPMMVASHGVASIYDAHNSLKVVATAYRVSGTIFCEPEDHAAAIFRTQWVPAGDPARVTGRPDRLMPLCYAECLGYGHGIGQWIPRATKLSGA